MEETIKKLTYTISEYMELPKDIVMDLPKITLIGDIYMTLENHLGIVEYTETMIRINTRSGELVISGENLKIKVIINEAIIINGQISGIKISK
ncbi:MAG TPA: sporulation protein YqfC [Thermoanaerobacterales bacterium]|nr:sporulation protein YqfC [Thermoanaerobacterales bacterium]